jgi:hypothetical protein
VQLPQRARRGGALAVFGLVPQAQIGAMQTLVLWEDNNCQRNLICLHGTRIKLQMHLINHIQSVDQNILECS